MKIRTFHCNSVSAVREAMKKPEFIQTVVEWSALDPCIAVNSKNKILQTMIELSRVTWVQLFDVLTATIEYNEDTPTWKDQPGWEPSIDIITLNNWTDISGLKSAEVVDGSI